MLRLLSSPLVLLFLSPLGGQVCGTDFSPTAHRYLYNLVGREGGKEEKRREVKGREGEHWGTGGSEAEGDVGSEREWEGENRE